MKNWWTIHFHWAKSCHDILALGSEAVAQEDDLPRSGVPQGNLECILRSQVLIWIIELFGNHIIQVVTVPGNPWRKDISNIKLYFFCRMWVLRCYILNYPRIRFCLGSGLPSLPCFVIFCSLILRKQTPRNGFHGALITSTHLNPQPGRLVEHFHAENLTDRRIIGGEASVFCHSRWGWACWVCGMHIGILEHWGMSWHITHLLAMIRKEAWSYLWAFQRFSDSFPDPWQTESACVGSHSPQIIYEL